MENVTELNLLDEKFDLKYINRISSDPTRAPELVRSKFFYLHSSSTLLENYKKITRNSYLRGSP